MFHQLKSTFVLVLFLRLFLESRAALDICIKCSCQGNRINCSSRNLTSVPRPIPPNIEYLNLTFNLLNEIKPGTFQNLPNLTTLYLNNNDIKELKAGSFQNLPSLGGLYLHENNISEIHVEAFQKLPNLLDLYLNNNDIKELKAGSFQNLSSLRILTTYSNHINEIKPGTFQNLPNLRYLVSHKNDIKEIHAGAFQNLPSLREILLYDNDIKELKAGSFENLSSLRTLVLHKNDIKEIHAGAFQNLPRLNAIYLFSNAIRKIESGAFQNLPSLTKLDLQNNIGMMCGCYLPALVNYTKTTFNRKVTVLGQCQADVGNNQTKSIPILEYSKCKSWTNSFVFHLIFNSTLKKFNEYKSSAVNISRAMEHELSNLTGTFEVAFCGFENNSGVFTINCTVSLIFTKDQIFKQVSETFKTSQTLRDLGLQQGNTELFDEMVCNENTTPTSNDTFYWPVTKVGTNVTIPCHANVATRRCSSRQAAHSEKATIQHMTSPKCSPFTGVWQEPDMSQCYNTERITQQLKNITGEGIDKENVEEASKALRIISEKSVYFKAEDIDLAVDIQEKMVPLISNVSTNITLNNILPSINDMINTPEEILVEAEQSKRTGKRMLDIIEAIPEEIPLEGQQLTIAYSNIGIGITKVEENSFNGLFYGVLYGNNETEVKTMIHNYSNPDPQVEDTGNFISLQKSLFKQLKEEERSTISRIAFFSLKDDKLYRVIQHSRTKANTKINSHIIAADVPNIQITSLDEPVNISFGPIDQDATNPRCVFWDESPGQDPKWSTEGCNTSEYVPGKKVLCSCNHLTSFALLMDVYQKSGETSHLLSMTSYIGCGISFVCLILTIIIHICCKNLWKLMASKILVNLCVSLAITNLIFLVGMQPYASKITAACKAVAALLHYFLMTSLMWMAVEALHVFLAAVVVFRTFQSHFLLTSSIVAWGVPGVIVIITLVINDTNNYVRIEQVCWLTKGPFYAAFLAPVAIILLFNLTMFFLVILRLISMQRDKHFQHKTRKPRILGIVGLISLFGLSWVLAFLAFGEAAQVFQLLFAIFNTLQGMFIFIFYCICKKDARDVICPCLRKEKKENARKCVEPIQTSENSRTAETNT